MNVSVEFCAASLPQALIKIAEHFKWDVYVDFDCGTPLIRKNTLSNQSIAWDKDSKCYEYWLTKSYTHRKNYLQLAYECNRATTKIEDAIAFLNGEFNPYKEVQSQTKVAS